jgi:hypothetical protein
MEIIAFRVVFTEVCSDELKSQSLIIRHFQVLCVSERQARQSLSLRDETMSRLMDFLSILAG